MPAGTVGDNTKVLQETLIDTYINIGSTIQAFVSNLDNGTLIHSITVTKLTYGNNFVAILLYETP
tara:strand:- start:111 stop:305 length:195 start_codon:yes stop_codon:yes gene_type:complete